MAKEKEVKEEKSTEQRVDELSATVGAMQAEMKRHSDNWKRHMIKFHDENGGGKVGGAAIWSMILAGILAASVAFGLSRNETNIVWNFTDSTGTNDWFQIDKQGNIYSEGNIWVNGTLTADYTNTVNSYAGEYGDLTVQTNAGVGGTLTVTGAVAGSSTLTISGKSALNADTTVKSNLFVTGNATVTGNFAVVGTTALTGNTTVQGAENVNGNFTVSTNKFAVTAANGNTSVAGTLGVTGVATFTAQPVFNAAILAAPTGSAVGGLSVKINGTNYAIAVIIPN